MRLCDECIGVVNKSNDLMHNDQLPTRNLWEYNWNNGTKMYGNEWH